MILYTDYFRLNQSLNPNLEPWRFPLPVYVGLPIPINFVTSFQ